MSDTNEYLVYYIYLSDLAQIQALQGSLVTPAPGIVGNGIGAILAAPDAAAIKYAAPILPPHSEVVAPGIGSTWFNGGDHFPTNVATFDRKSGGWFGWSWLFGDTTHYHWRGIFVYVPPVDVPGVPVPINISNRRWIDGFEGAGEGGDNRTATCSREASRHVDGFGMAIRPDGGSGVKTHITNENGGAQPARTWERFYVRLRQAPAVATTFWRMRRNVSANAGIVLQIAPSGQLTVYSCDAIGGLSFVAAISGLTDKLWHRLDLFITVGGGAFQVWLDGTVVLSSTAIPDIVGVFVHVSSEMGTGVAHTLALDIDDWILCDQPASTDGVDFQNGSAVRLISPTGIVTPGTWVGDYRTLLQNPIEGALATINSSTASDTIVVSTDAHAVISEDAQSIGCVAIMVGINVAIATMRAGAILGLDTTDAGIAGTKTGALSTSGTWFSFLWKIPATPTPVKPVDPIRLTFTHGSAGTTPTKALLAVAELLGTFGPEDAPHVTPRPTVPTHLGIHNAPYPNTPWARLSTPPEQPVYIKSGTYTGNGTGQDLVFPVPIHFLWVRPLTGGFGGLKWFSSMLASHKGTDETPVSTLMVRARLNSDYVPTLDAGPVPAAPATLQEAIDLSNAMAYGRAYNDAGYAGWAAYLTDPTYFFRRMLGEGAGGVDIPPFGLFAVPPTPWNVAQQQYLLSLAGADVDSNAAGVVYAYIAIGDPGMRFMLNGALAVNRGTADEITTLVHPTFTPRAGFFAAEDRATTGETHYLKGPGHAPSSISPISGAVLANALAWGPAANQLTNKSAFAAAADQTAFSLWRNDDGGPGNSGKVVQINTYTGNGAASRSIGLTPASGKRPLWALIVPHNARAWSRDASHTALSSTQTDGSIADTGITGGDIDTLVLGSSLNTNGVVYEVIVIPGSDVAGNGGFSVPGEFIPVSPTPPPGAPTDSADHAEPPAGPIADDSGGGDTGTLPDPLPPSGPMPSLTDDLDEACEPDTRRMINIALTRIGVSKQIANVATDQTAEAAAVRLIYNDAIQQTLRDFPWPFATRYVQLARVGTTRPNSDWLFSYRQPGDCLLERRIVVSRTDVANPDQVPFQLSSDDTGGLIFCNLANAVLEYTARPKCVHTRSEALFRDAAAWKMAEALSPSLTRLPEHKADCAKEYSATIGQAYVVLRPGNPGEMPATATVDTSAAAKAANLAVVNLALVQIGAPTVLNLATDQTRSAQVARMIFEQELRAVLRDYPWQFASKYATLTLLGGTAATRLNNDWQYSYRLPADTVFVRRIMTEFGRSYERTPPPFRTAIDATGGILYTAQADAEIEYTTRPEAAVLNAEPLFREALAWRLSWKMAPSLAQVVPERPEAIGRGPDETKALDKERPSSGNQLRARAAETARTCYYFAIGTARTTDANAQQPDIQPPDADWISGRDGWGGLPGPDGWRNWRN